VADDIRVASVPSGHVYVRHLAPLAADTSGPRVTRLPDPDPLRPDRPAASVWWPPTMLEPDWVAQADGFDLMHLQFGFDARSPQQLQQLVDALRRRGKPLVYTVHDLRNPHHPDRSEHDAQLDVLIPAADALVTLTTGAADEIERRWGRRPAVLPHPHVVELDTMAELQRTSVTAPAGEPFRIGVHVKSLRASMNPIPVIRALLDLMHELPDAVLQVDGHSDVLLPDGARFDPELAGLVRSAHESGRLDLRIHDFFSDAELWAYLRSLDVSVLPYRFGTHSGWLEACRDLGTIVVAPDCGYYRDQGPVVEYHNDESGLDARSLQDAVRFAYETRPYVTADVAERAAQREDVAAAHARLYASLVG
jgi:glycosyltransferase involved in cell wall biosynthesis